MGHLKITTMALVFISSVGQAKIPSWAAHNSTKLNGQVLTTVCNGTGPSLDIARSEALKSCQLSASQFFKTKIQIKSISVETEKSVGFHQEVTNADAIEGLICDPQRDQIEENDSNFSVWLECKFDLKRVISTPIEQKNGSSDNSQLNTLETTKIESKQDNQAKQIFISTVPKCDSVIIKGVRSRTVLCSQNPLKIQIKDDDEEIIIRAKGYKPKTIKAKGVNTNESIQVLLDLL